MFCFVFNILNPCTSSSFSDLQSMFLARQARFPTERQACNPKGCGGSTARSQGSRVHLHPPKVGQYMSPRAAAMPETPTLHRQVGAAQAEGRCPEPRVVSFWRHSCCARDTNWRQQTPRTLGVWFSSQHLPSLVGYWKEDGIKVRFQVGDTHR